MRVLVHDHSGHAFQVELSRELARRGHQVLHIHCATFVSPKGNLTRTEDDPPTFRVETLSHASEFRKYSLHRRVPQEVAYGRRFAERAAAYDPDVILLCNTPLFTQHVITGWAARRSIACLMWLQDVYSLAATEAIRARRPYLARPAALLLSRLEGDALRRSTSVISISEDFVPALQQWGIPNDRRRVIPNWAPLEELPVALKDNPWSRRHQLDHSFVFLYTGTLGLKHDPGLLLALAEEWARDRAVIVLVVSQGIGAEWLREQAVSRRLANLLILPYQPHALYPEVLGTGDVLVAILEREAGTFSVPSKVLSYHCARRPILAVVPEENQAALTVRDAGSGFVVPPGDTGALLRAAAELRGDALLRDRLGQRARAYAEANFDVTVIAQRFEQALEEAVASRAVR